MFNNRTQDPHGWRILLPSWELLHFLVDSHMIGTHIATLHHYSCYPSWPLFTPTLHGYSSSLLFVITLAAHHRYSSFLLFIFTLHHCSSSLHFISIVHNSSSPFFISTLCSYSSLLFLLFITTFAALHSYPSWLLYMTTLHQHFSSLLLLLFISTPASFHHYVFTPSLFFFATFTTILSRYSSSLHFIATLPHYPS